MTHNENKEKRKGHKTGTERSGKDIKLGQREKERT